ncbi:glutaryl-CoA dehydrogenase [Emiliania huxleyi CCMP1516]|uniref:Acyl-CoA dehydrogenase/oxidase N-terminal domain-containing protein n=2 Tax=Emiliania huxleyi TaxID=2903 RepID=A0A0D3IBR2_EMIH1|nr:glutaryl-CoA dehydrogenase [Emiliania huxleyi CCMP1516]EOD08697.1 glutaryl-CoA dehydrogenase [Emiliania huxleyi CCMP1516]|eukprot:XP_005761126.1 glutaryl-CoA dehydrogenase [Emiliania huxleyi CCMP1516]
MIKACSLSRSAPNAARVAARRLSTAAVSDLDHDLPSLPAAAPSLATAKFDWTDPLALSASLTEEASADTPHAHALHLELAVYESARSFAQRELKPGIVEATRQGHFDRGIMRAFGQMGLLGLTSPVEYGGGGAGYVSYGLGARAVEQVDSGYRPRW